MFSCSTEHSQGNLLFNSSTREEPAPSTLACWAQARAQLFSCSTTCTEHAMKYREVLIEPQRHICTALLEDSWMPGQWSYLILKCCISALNLKVLGYLQSAWGMYQDCTWLLVLLGMAHFPAQSLRPSWKGSSDAWQWFVCTTHIWQPF